MRTITCIDCDQQFSGETKEELMKNMHPHYMEAHKDVMAAGDKDKQMAWFAELDKRWEQAAAE